MTREEAIEHILDVSSAANREFCCSYKEDQAAEAKMAEALRTLGVTDEELGLT